MRTRKSFHCNNMSTNNCRRNDGIRKLPFGTYHRTEYLQSLKVPPHKILTTKGQNRNLKDISLIK